MALKKTDCLILLGELQDKENLPVKEYISKLMKSESIPAEVITFLNQNMSLDMTEFYEMLRKNYNKKKSNLYINIVKEIEEPQEVLTTLAALQLQIILYSKHVENKKMFFNSMRAEELNKVLLNYYKNFDITSALHLLRYYKADLKLLEK